MAGPFDKIPDIPTLERRFNFIDNENVRQNIAICFQYIIFLTVVNSLYDNGGPIQLSINRDIVVHTASVIEASLQYTITKLIHDGKINPNTIATGWEVKKHALIHKISDTHLIISAHKIRTMKIVQDNPMSQDINRAALATKILDDNLYRKAESIRESRNNIHIIGEDKKVVYPSREEVEALFEDARDILKKIESKINEPITDIISP